MEAELAKLGFDKSPYGDAWTRCFDTPTGWVDMRWEKGRMTISKDAEYDTSEYNDTITVNCQSVTKLTMVFAVFDLPMTYATNGGK